MIRSIKRAPLERDAPLPLPRKKPWSGLSASILLHSALVVLIILTIQHENRNDAKTASRAPQVQPVSMVYVPPPRRQPPLPVPRRPDPLAEQARDNANALTTQPDVDLPPAVEHADPSISAPEPVPETPRPEETVASRTPPPPTPQPTMESEAQRIFGRPLLRRQQQNPAQLGIHPGDASNRDASARTNCMPKPKDPDAPLEMATLDGRVNEEGSNRPLAGAFLQIMGTAYSTYSDQMGHYRLVFDASLVDECRTQYVRVVAPGYRGRNLILGVGPGINDVLLGR
ncbi:MAG: hypothetical protein ABI679_03970 [Gemmatimonadota bacterium]